MRDPARVVCEEERAPTAKGRTTRQGEDHAARVTALNMDAPNQQAFDVPARESDADGPLTRGAGNSQHTRD